MVAHAAVLFHEPRNSSNVSFAGPATCLETFIVQQAGKDLIELN